MSKTHSRISILNELVSLEARRAELYSELQRLPGSSIDHRSARAALAGAQAEGSGAQHKETSGGARGRARSGASASHAIKPGKRAGRGALKEVLFSELQAAGRSGVIVKDLAAKLGIKPVNIHAWFHAAVKRYPQVKKVSGGHYRLDGSAPAGQKGRAAAAASPARKAAAPSRTASGRSPRGQLSAGIMEQLQSAGKSGISVRDIAQNLGIDYKNVSIWFSTTGKKNGKVKKIDRGMYRLA